MLGVTDYERLASHLWGVTVLQAASSVLTETGGGKNKEL